MTQLAEHVFNVMTSEGNTYRISIKPAIKQISRFKSAWSNKYTYLLTDKWKSLAHRLFVECELVRPDEFYGLMFTERDRDALADMLEEKYAEDVKEGIK